MARKRWDLQVFWVVVLSLAFWAAIFRHDDVFEFAGNTWTFVRSFFPK
jgi:hypothetical protein